MLALVAHSLKPFKLLVSWKQTRHCWPETPNSTQQCCDLSVCMGLNILNKKFWYKRSSPSSFKPRSLEEKIVTRSLEGVGGRGVRLTSTFDTIHPIDMKLGTYNKLHLYFQLSETTWCLIGFHGNSSQINDVTGGRHLGFLNFQILFKFSLLYFKMTRKQDLAVEIQKNS